jgi:putative two-component system response regulator
MDNKDNKKNRSHEFSNKWEDHKSTVMVVDDDPRSRKLIEAYLFPQNYNLVTAADGTEALEKLKDNSVDLIVLDVMLPGISGYEVCKKVKSDSDLRLIPIIMMTSLDGKEDKIKGIQAGTDDFLTKPIDPQEITARVKSLLRVRHLNEQLEKVENILFTLAKALEAKDPYTEGHSERVTDFAIKLAREIGLSKESQELLDKAGKMHDIGKVGVPETILNKPGPLTKEEFNYIKKHAVLSEKICDPLRSMREILGIIRHHHENFNGKGYPDGLQGDSIPLEARILSIADAYDAMSSDRPYRKKLSKQEVVKRLKEGAGSQWDPKLVDIFVKILESSDEQ